MEIPKATVLSVDEADVQFMTMALGLARRGLGQVWPNPAVGCVIVNGGHVVGRGWTQQGGRPHAETEALERAGLRAAGATAYVTLEPCAHQGKTPPCCDALIRAGVRRVVAAVEDPDPRVAGRGFEKLKDAGVEVDVGLQAEPARALNAGFFLRTLESRPLFTWKVAASLDGRLATASGDSKWITGPGARALGHHLRASHDAILVGSETALTDDPELTCRLPGLSEASPVRVIADRRLRLPETAKLVQTAQDQSTWVITNQHANPARIKALRRQRVEVLTTESAQSDKLEVTEIAKLLAAKGVTRVLIEGGGTLAASFVNAGLVDEIVWFQSGKLIGADGIAALGPIEVQKVAQSPAYQRMHVEVIAEDTVTYYVRRAPPDGET